MTSVSGGTIGYAEIIAIKVQDFQSHYHCTFSRVRFLVAESSLVSVFHSFYSFSILVLVLDFPFVLMRSFLSLPKKGSGTDYYYVLYFLWVFMSDHSTVMLL